MGMVDPPFTLFVHSRHRTLVWRQRRRVGIGGMPWLNRAMNLTRNAIPYAIVALAVVHAAPAGLVDEDNAWRLAANGTASFVAASIETQGQDGAEWRHLGLASDGAEQRRASTTSRRAYVTLLYSDFIHGTRALGQSLRESGTSADTVVLVTPDVRPETRATLAEDGWM